MRFLYTPGAMALYQLPKHSPYQRTLWVLSESAIVSLLGILLFSFFEPPGLSDSIAHSIGWTAGVITVASVLGLTLLSVKDATWKLKQKLRFEVSDGIIIQSSDDGVAVEIPLNNVESVHEYSGWLLIRGGEPIRQIAVPREINDFEALRRQLTSDQPVIPVKTKARLFLFLPVVLAIIAWFLLLTSRNRVVVAVSAVVALGFQTVGAYSMIHIWRAKGKPIFFVSMAVLAWLLVAGIVIQRVKSVW